MTQAGKISPGFMMGGPAMARRQTSASFQATKKTIRWPVFLFLVGLVVPWMIFVGPLRISIYRIVLLVMIVPCLIMWVTGKAGRIRIADIAILLFSSWYVISLTAVHGVSSSIQTSGIVFVEAIGPYLLARCYIRDADDFYNMTQLLFRIVIVLLPFAIFEFVTGQNVLRELFAVKPSTSLDVAPQRLGLTRVQSVFDHPILFGVCTGSICALVNLVLGYQKGFLQRGLRTGIVGLTSALSLSAGPLIAVAVQAFLLSWNSVLGAIKMRWKILIGLLVVIVFLAEIVANRSLLAFASSYFTFDDQSYWFRMLIWHYGSASSLNNPLFGVGLNEWERPEWMPSSIDNIWLYLAVHYGLPAPILLLLALLSIVLAVGFKKGIDDRTASYRTAFLITLVAFFLVGWTVHFWDAAYVLFLFLMGSGIWILDVKSEKRTVALRMHPEFYRPMGGPTRSRHA